MEVIGIATSPRKGANSQALVEHILSGAKKAGAQTNLYGSASLTSSPALAATAAKKGNGCVQKDDFAGLVKKLEKADSIVIGSPVYGDGSMARPTRSSTGVIPS